LAQKSMTKETWTDLWEYKQYEKSNHNVFPDFVTKKSLNL